MTHKLLITNAAQLITMEGHTERPAIKSAMSELDIIENGALYIEDGKVVEVGSSEEIM